jgi:hypothetical protein
MLDSDRPGCAARRCPHPRQPGAIGYCVLHVDLVWRFATWLAGDEFDRDRVALERRSVV